MLFLASVLVRLPNLNRPLSKHHEFVTAHMLIMLESWEAKGLGYFQWNPVQLYPEAATQQHYLNTQSALADEHGNLYYTSFPPFAYYLPYGVFRIFGIPFTPLSLQLLNLVFHGLSAFLLFWWSRDLFKTSLHAERGVVVVAAVHLFTPATLWFQSNTFFADLFCINLFIPAAYFAYYTLRTSGTAFRQNTIGLFICLFLLMYTEWIGGFLGLVVGLVALWNARKTLRQLWILPSVFFAVALPLMLTLWQYSLIGGWDALLEGSLSRWNERGLASNSDAPVWQYIKRWRFVLWHYTTGFGLFAVLGFGWCVCWLIPRKWGKKVENTVQVSDWTLLFLVLFLPVLLHHAVLIKYTMFHDFSVLKAAPFLAICCGALFLHFHKKRKLASLGLLTVVLLTGIAQYYYINRPGAISRSGERYDVMQTIGKTIHESVSQDEVVFLNGIKGSPQIIYYAKRNIFFAQDTEQAKVILKEVNADRGRLFYVENNRVSQQELILAE